MGKTRRKVSIPSSPWVRTLRLLLAHAERYSSNQHLNWRMVADDMAASRVIRVTPEQAEALPALAQSRAEEIDLLDRVRLPFERVFIEIGAAESSTDLNVNWCDTPLYGALLLARTDGAPGAACLPVWSAEGQVFAFGMTASAPDHVRRLKTRRPEWASTDPNDDPRRTAMWTLMPSEMLKRVDPVTGKSIGRDVSDALGSGLVRALRIIYMLESANVELRELSDAYPRAHRAHGVPHFEVLIRKTARSQRRPDAIGGHVDYSHRFEVRGHFKHYGPDTRLFQATERDHPEKVLDMPERGRCVRTWCPPFVKGPEDKPLIPKRRVVAA